MTLADIRRVLARKSPGFVFDIDGTLSPIAPTPDEAQLYPGVADHLQQLSQYGQIAIMTGRTVVNGAALVNVEGLIYVGTHGLEWSDGLPDTHPVHIVPEALEYVKAGKYLLDLAEQKLAILPGLIIERKSVGGAIHYRLTPNPEQARQQILDLLQEPAQEVQMRLGEGKRVVEIRPPLNINKGQALRRFVQRYALESIIFAGDDRTDLDAILEIGKLRQEGLDALAVVVQHHDTLPALLKHADILVQEVEGMAQLLREIVELMQSLHKDATP